MFLGLFVCFWRFARGSGAGAADLEKPFWGCVPTQHQNLLFDTQPDRITGQASQLVENFRRVAADFLIPKSAETDNG